MQAHPKRQRAEPDSGAGAPIRVVVAATNPPEAERSRAVGDAAIELAALHGAELHFLSVVAPVHLAGAGTEGMAQREALRQAAPGLDAFVARADRCGVTASWRVWVAKLEDAIPAEAEESGADLVVVAPPKRWLPGRWLRKLRRSVGAPVLCVPVSTQRAPELEGARILVPTFRRAGALRAVAQALRVFRPSPAGPGSRVRLLRPQRKQPLPGGDAPAAPSLERSRVANADEEHLARLARDLREIGIPTETDRARDADPVEAVAQAARDAEADVIALGPRPRRSGLWSRLRRSFLGRLLQRSSRPLLVP